MTSLTDSYVDQTSSGSVFSRKSLMFLQSLLGSSRGQALSMTLGSALL